MFYPAGLENPLLVSKVAEEVVFLLTIPILVHTSTMLTICSYDLQLGLILIQGRG
jgi:hypothetical protein